MQVLLVTEGTYPHVHGGVSVWCDQMIRGLDRHQFHLYALVATGREKPVWELPANVLSQTTLPIWTMRRTPPVRRRDRGVPGDRAVRERQPGGGFAGIGSAGIGSAGTSSAGTDTDAAISLLEASLSTEPNAAEHFEAALFELFLIAQRTELTPLLRTRAVTDALADCWARSPQGAGLPLNLADALSALDLIEHALRPLSAHPPKTDVTHALSNGLAALVGLAAKWTHGTPFVLAEHGVYLRERYLALRTEQLTWPVKAILAGFTRRLCETGYRAADLITPCAEFNQRWERRLGADPAKLRTVYNGIDPDRFPPTPAEPDEPTIVFVGRIDPLKDLLTLIRAFALVHAELPTARLRIFGAAPSGGHWYLETCLDLVAELGLGEALTFEGQCDNIREAYSAGHIVVLSSISEGLPFTVIEAMACGRPMVGTEVGGVGEAIGDTGLVVPPRRPGEMAQACLSLLTDDERRRELGRKARERALAEFTVARAVQTFNEVYDAVTRPAAAAGTADEMPMEVPMPTSRSAAKPASKPLSKPVSEAAA
jgi:polysaccharide biosynthesis protein PelF